VVPAYNAANTLQLCLDALAKQDFLPSAYEVIVVDDGSTDGTAALARSASVRVISQPNAGPAAARNAGASVARGEYLLFTDADCAPVPGWIEALVGALEDRRVAGAKGAYLTRQQGIVPRFTQLEYQDRYDRMAGAESIDFVDTYSAAYRRDVFFANGGFDPSLLKLEDQELSFRLAEKGYLLVFQPDAAVYHRHNPTLRAYALRKFYIGYWKALLARSHPGRMVRDSHTPQVLKVQMLLAAAVLAALAFAAGTALFNATTAWLGLVFAGLLLLLFFVTTLPFLAKVWRRDRAILLPAVGLLWVRALALGFGFVAGTAGFRGSDLGRRATLSASQRVAKRGMDLLLGAATLVLFAIPMALIALAVKLDSRGPAFFTQIRIGENGKPFRILKFRTMVVQAEELLPQLVDIVRLPEPAFKLRDDPRITRLGRLLRRFSLDELPQLINVMRGEMSLVGPRPEEAAIVARYTDDQRRRLMVKPGMTGPMQVNGRGDLSFEARLALELDYIERYSLRRDLSILWRTLPAVLRGDGAY
jgi:lipopolysaccharide/colanic/teichoic acid biosynthesis glycosyltransferase/glycosyltransferase involved in cell wall biosynthesis